MTSKYLAVLLASGATVLTATAPAAQAQAGGLYGCSAADYTNIFSAAEAQARQCAKIYNA